jgi:hypothetical protein
MLRSLTGIVDQATVVASAVVSNMSVLDSVPPELRSPLVVLIDAVFDLDYRTAGIEPVPSGSPLPRA